MLHEQSHGEAFVTLVENRFGQGLYFLDEPEAAFSPQRIVPIVYKETEHYRVINQFMEAPDRMLKHLLADA